ncbi:MAG: hypothetical protein A3D35_03045 [Candidatus Staskawiczbacteria bacterium RIFCSPHIGHO2_02_FULL_34_9]|uniref:PARP-type domain-containing protein n=1 Tax=Candidatus Staskawiczbacteria bacterium RIFCSPHIGHO2_02_FULL_34_9 TaxID=1802206 RepID=A0A1G2I362_9BACT|nr:MAG: hypothetical protein A3D35_03045 [Candidatus Staskawiczbacteria bacterium RIFCSPHIGHO2_02_FULL_34_9]
MNTGRKTFAPCEVVIAYHEARITCGCKDCKKILAQGYYAIGLDIREPNRNYRYLLGVDPPVLCCGHDRKVLLLFESVEEADKKQKEIIEFLDREKSTEKLRLFEFAKPGELN